MIPGARSALSDRAGGPVSVPRSKAAGARVLLLAFALLYRLFGLGLDRLHVDRSRYYGWSVDQIASGLMLLLAAVTVLELGRLKRAGARKVVALEVTCSRDSVNS